MRRVRPPTAWHAAPVAERIACYRRLAETLRSRSETLAGLIAAEMGKTLGEARAEVEKTAATLDWLVEHGPAGPADEPAQTGGNDEAYASNLPINTILAVMAWNSPIWQVLRATGPIMLSGNGFLLKHAPNVMGCAYALQEAYTASGFPKGLFAILNAGDDAAAMVIADPRARPSPRPEASGPALRWHLPRPRR